MFYSASTGPSDEYHRLRLAVASDPAGPFIDSGRPFLPDAGFTIDASPFRDPQSGKYYLFFATDYETDEPHGTGLAVVELADDLMSATSATPARHPSQADWQIYERNRDYKGKSLDEMALCRRTQCAVPWRKILLFLFRRPGMATTMASDSPSPTIRWDHGATISLPTGAVVLKGIPGKIIGPGHNSHVLGPDDRDDLYGLPRVGCRQNSPAHVHRSDRLDAHWAQSRWPQCRTSRAYRKNRIGLYGERHCPAASVIPESSSGCDAPATDEMASRRIRLGRTRGRLSRESDNASVKADPTTRFRSRCFE